MCENCASYEKTGAGYCLKCGAPVKNVKEASEEEFFKHASEDLLEEEIKKEEEKNVV